MKATIINAVLVLIGSALGLVFKNRIGEKFSRVITHGLALCVMLIGISGAIGTENVLCVIICMVVGIAIGEGLRIEDRLDSLGETIRVKLMKGRESGRFTEGFMTATLIFCVGSMSIMGSMEAGINGDYSILLSKSVMDAITSVTLAAAMGVGVCFSALGVLVYQGLLTLLFMWTGPFLPQAVITEMSAVGGLIIVAISVNMLGLGREKLRTGNMLPAIFLPIAYIPLANLISKLFA